MFGSLWRTEGESGPYFHTPKCQILMRSGMHFMIVFSTFSFTLRKQHIYPPPFAFFIDTCNQTQTSSDISGLEINYLPTLLTKQPDFVDGHSSLQSTSSDLLKDSLVLVIKLQ